VRLCPEPFTRLTYMFLHANTTQLLEIMAVPWICGDNVEDALGHRRYLLFYVFCGVVAGMVHVYFNATSDIPLVGASGAIVGMIGGYVVLYPRIKMWALVGVIPLRLNASWVLGWWAVSQVATLFVAPSERSASGRISAALFAACRRRVAAPYQRASDPAAATAFRVMAANARISERATNLIITARAAKTPTSRAH
jgi:membrane associated rhomboid family serine protease